MEPFADELDSTVATFLDTGVARGTASRRDNAGFPDRRQFGCLDLVVLAGEVALSSRIVWGLASE